jgi:hypothetical protein
MGASFDGGCREAVSGEGAAVSGETPGGPEETALRRAGFEIDPRRSDEQPAEE